MTTCNWGRRISRVSFALFLLLPGVCVAQPAGSASFGKLPDNVRAGNIVIVTDDAGREIRGKVTEVSSTSLVILEKDGSGQWATPTTFTPQNVREIKRTGKIWDKAVVGFVIGAAIVLIGGEDCVGCDKGGAAMLIGGIGAGIGLAFDAGFGPARVYRAPASTRAGFSLMPMVGRDRNGGLLAYRF